MSGEPISYGSVLLYNELHTVGRGNSIEDGTVVIDKLYDGMYHLMIFASSSGFFHGWYGEIPTKTNNTWDNDLEIPKIVIIFIYIFHPRLLIKVLVHFFALAEKRLLLRSSSYYDHNFLKELIGFLFL